MWAGPRHLGPVRAACPMPGARVPKPLCPAALVWPQAWSARSAAPTQRPARPEMR